MSDDDFDIVAPSDSGSGGFDAVGSGSLDEEQPRKRKRARRVKTLADKSTQLHGAFLAVSVLDSECSYIDEKWAKSQDVQPHYDKRHTGIIAFVLYSWQLTPAGAPCQEDLVHSWQQQLLKQHRRNATRGFLQCTIKHIFVLDGNMFDLDASKLKASTRGSTAT